MRFGRQRVDNPVIEAKLPFQYDREGDILYINKRPPYPEQESEELGDQVIARMNPKTGEIENLKILFFSTPLLRSDLFELPVTAELRFGGQGIKSTDVALLVAEGGDLEAVLVF